MMAWAEYAEDAVTVSKGAPKTINSSGASMRSFCPDCGTGLFYRNAEILPGVVEVQLATFDVDGKLAPAMQIVTAQRVAWASDLSTIPAHEGFPE